MFIEVPPEEVDVNVHPAKAEVRFRSPDKAFSFVQRSTRRALLAYAPVPQLAPQNLWSTPSQPGQIDPTWSLAHDFEDEKQNQESGTQPAGADLQSPILNPQSSISPVPLLRLIGQIGATYLVAEGPDGLYLIDQHAAHERVLFEKLMAQYAQKSIPSQALLTPVVVHLPPAICRLAEDQIPVLLHFGFHVEPFGQNSYQVRAMPALFASSDPAAALRALVEDFEEDEAPLQNEIEAKIAGRVCKRLAVKAGRSFRRRNSAPCWPTWKPAPRRAPVRMAARP